MKSKSEQAIKVASLCCIAMALLAHVNPVFHALTFLLLGLLQVLLFFKADFFSHQRSGSVKFQTYRILCFLCLITSSAIFILNERLGDDNQQTTYLLFFFFLLFGNYAPKIPFNRTLGLRLPWTIQNEVTWRYAHRLVGYLSIPCAFLYLIGALMHQESLSLLAFVCWIFIPAFASYRYDKERNHHEENKLL